jgi:dTDP-glucose 4,6-dehydratase
MSFAPRNVCITGGAGFIGANFVRHWLDISREGQVVVLDALTYAGNLENLAGLERNPRYVFVRGDICDEGAVRESARALSHRHGGALRGGIARRSLDSRA